MTTHIALLRAINVGGRAPVAMADLRRLFERLGFIDVRSLLQSGNVIFRSKASGSASLEQLLEAEVGKGLAPGTDVVVRTAKEWKSVIAHNPFREEADRDPSRLVVMFLKTAPTVSAVKALQGAITGPEVVRAHRQQAYIVYPNGIGRSRLTNTVIEKALGTRGTARNWNTVLKLGALVAG